jgi:hypothetical protein
MAQMPYSPMHGPEKLVTQEEMWARLAKHAPAQVELLLSKTETQSPQENPAVAPLQWQQPVKTGDGYGYVLTQCGRFSIEKRPVRGASMYMAWRRRDPAETSTSLGIRTTRREAEHLCELEAARER